MAGYEREPILGVSVSGRTEKDSPPHCGRRHQRPAIISERGVSSPRAPRQIAGVLDPPAYYATVKCVLW